MRHLSAILLVVCAAAIAHAETPQFTHEFFVSPQGNDGWSGLLAEPKADGSDGPFATIMRARDAVRGVDKAGPVAVTVRGGTYYVTEPIRFAPEDSGRDGAPVVYRAYAGETPVIHGGRAVQGWKQEGNLWVADVPEVRDGAWNFSAFFVNGDRRQPARTPNAANPWGDYPPDSDFLYMDGPVVEKDASGNEVKSATKFRFREGDVQDWASLKDAEFVIFHSWATSRLRVKNIDIANRIIEFTGPARWPFAYWRGDQWYFIEHLREALDVPGEWFLDRKAGKIFYMPMPGEDMNTAEAVAPVASQLLLLEGEPAAGRFVEHVRFEGLRFYYGDYTVGPEGLSDSQAAVTVPGAVEAAGARDCGFDRCEIAHVGTYALWFRSGCKSCWMRQCEAFDLGAGGVRIGEGASPATPNEAAEWNVADNCFLHEGGRIFREAVGVWIGRSSYNTVSHNEVCDFRYSGMSVGWSWGYDPSSAHDNIIEYNHIHHVGKGQLSDMGGIYTLGVSPGTVLRGNYIHHILSNGKISGGWGLYTDEGSSYIHLEDNVILHTRTGSFHQHYGRENTVRNNIFAFSEREQLIRSRQEEHLSFYFVSNIVLYNNGSLLGSNWGNGNYRMDHNVYWDLSGAVVDFAGQNLDEWRATGQDVNSVIADPLIKDVTAGDFRLAPDSPAVKMGFRPIDVSKAGLYGAPEWVGKAQDTARAPIPLPAAPEPVTLSDSFEDTPVGMPAAGAETLGEEGAAAIRVTDETAATGTHSLKIADAPGLAKAFNPHLVYAPHMRTGKVTGKCAMRLEPGAVVYVEWRDRHEPYRVGPSIAFDGAGGLAVQGKKLLDIPTGTWFELEITCALGTQADGTFDLAVRIPDREAKDFSGLSCGSAAFNRLDWLGFVASGDLAATCYLDDLHLTVQ